MTVGDVKQRQRQAWAAGDYRTAGARIQIVSEMLCEAVDLRGVQTVLDVATGTGNTAIAAARRWCEVAAIDYVPSLLEIGRVRAAAEGVPVAFLEGDAEEIGFTDNAFDVVLSTFGSMFAPNHEKAADQHIRVCRPGGKIGMANWTPTGFGGAFFGAVTQLVPPPQGQKPPSLWGTEDHLRQLFGDRVTLEVKPQHFVFRYRSPAHWIEVFSTTFGPVMKALEALDDPGRERLRLELHRVIGEFNKATDGTMVVPSEYLEVVATKS
jgi:ubiquinone/menaquinone biosynthesis C-methylase UbiE